MLSPDAIATSLELQQTCGDRHNDQPFVQLDLPPSASEKVVIQPFQRVESGNGVRYVRAESSAALQQVSGAQSCVEPAPTSALREDVHFPLRLHHEDTATKLRHFVPAESLPKMQSANKRCIKLALVNVVDRTTGDVRITYAGDVGPGEELVQ